MAADLRADTFLIQLQEISITLSKASKVVLNVTLPSQGSLLSLDSELKALQHKFTSSLPSIPLDFGSRKQDHLTITVFSSKSDIKSGKSLASTQVPCDAFSLRHVSSFLQPLNIDLGNGLELSIKYSLSSPSLLALQLGQSDQRAGAIEDLLALSKTPRFLDFIGHQSVVEELFTLLKSYIRKHSKVSSVEESLNELWAAVATNSRAFTRVCDVFPDLDEKLWKLVMKDKMKNVQHYGLVFVVLRGLTMRPGGAGMIPTVVEAFSNAAGKASDPAQQRFLQLLIPLLTYFDPKYAKVLATKTTLLTDIRTALESAKGANFSAELCAQIYTLIKFFGTEYLDRMQELCVFDPLQELAFDSSHPQRQVLSFKLLEQFGIEKRQTSLPTLASSFQNETSSNVRLKLLHTIFEELKRTPPSAADRKHLTSILVSFLTEKLDLVVEEVINILEFMNLSLEESVESGLFQTYNAYLTSKSFPKVTVPFLFNHFLRIFSSLVPDAKEEEILPEELPKPQPSDFFERPSGISTNRSSRSIPLSDMAIIPILELLDTLLDVMNLKWSEHDFREHVVLWTHVYRNSDILRDRVDIKIRKKFYRIGAMLDASNLAYGMEDALLYEDITLAHIVNTLELIVDTSTSDPEFSNNAASALKKFVSALKSTIMLGSLNRTVSYPYKPRTFLRLRAIWPSIEEDYINTIVRSIKCKQEQLDECIEVLIPSVIISTFKFYEMVNLIHQLSLRCPEICADKETIQKRPKIGFELLKMLNCHVEPSHISGNLDPEGIFRLTCWASEYVSQAIVEVQPSPEKLKAESTSSPTSEDSSSSPTSEEPTKEKPVEEKKKRDYEESSNDDATGSSSESDGIDSEEIKKGRRRAKPKTTTSANTTTIEAAAPTSSSAPNGDGVKEEDSVKPTVGSTKPAEPTLILDKDVLSYTDSLTILECLIKLNSASGADPLAVKLKSDWTPWHSSLLFLRYLFGITSEDLPVASLKSIISSAALATPNDESFSSNFVAELMKDSNILFNTFELQLQSFLLSRTPPMPSMITLFASSLHQHWPNLKQTHLLRRNVAQRLRFIWRLSRLFEYVHVYNEACFFNPSRDYAFNPLRNSYRGYEHSFLLQTTLHASNEFRRFSTQAMDNTMHIAAPGPLYDWVFGSSQNTNYPACSIPTLIFPPFDWNDRMDTILKIMEIVGDCIDLMPLDRMLPPKTDEEIVCEEDLSHRKAVLESPVAPALVAHILMEAVQVFYSIGGYPCTRISRKALTWVCDNWWPRLYLTPEFDVNAKLNNLYASSGQPLLGMASPRSSLGDNDQHIPEFYAVYFLLHYNDPNILFKLIRGLRLLRFSGASQEAKNRKKFTPHLPYHTDIVLRRYLALIEELVANPLDFEAARLFPPKWELGELKPGIGVQLRNRALHPETGFPLPTSLMPSEDGEWGDYEELDWATRSRHLDSLNHTPRNSPFDTAMIAANEMKFFESDDFWVSVRPLVNLLDRSEMVKPTPENLDSRKEGIKFRASTYLKALTDAAIEMALLINNFDGATSIPSAHPMFVVDKIVFPPKKSWKFFTFSPPHLNNLLSFNYSDKVSLGALDVGSYFLSIIFNRKKVEEISNEANSLAVANLASSSEPLAAKMQDTDSNKPAEREPTECYLNHTLQTTPEFLDFAWRFLGALCTIADPPPQSVQLHASIAASELLKIEQETGNHRLEPTYPFWKCSVVPTLAILLPRLHRSIAVSAPKDSSGSTKDGEASPSKSPPTPIKKASKSKVSKKSNKVVSSDSAPVPANLPSILLKHLDSEITKLLQHIREISSPTGASEDLPSANDMALAAGLYVNEGGRVRKTGRANRRYESSQSYSETDSASEESSYSGSSASSIDPPRATPVGYDPLAPTDPKKDSIDEAYTKSKEWSDSLTLLRSLLISASRIANVDCSYLKNHCLYPENASTHIGDPTSIPDVVQEGFSGPLLRQLSALNTLILRSRREYNWRPLFLMLENSIGTCSLGLLSPLVTSEEETVRFLSDPFWRLVLQENYRSRLAGKLNIFPYRLISLAAKVGIFEDTSMPFALYREEAKQHMTSLVSETLNRAAVITSQLGLLSMITHLPDYFTTLIKSNYISMWREGLATDVGIGFLMDMLNDQPAIVELLVRNGYDTARRGQMPRLGSMYVWLAKHGGAHAKLPRFIRAPSDSLSLASSSSSLSAATSTSASHSSSQQKAVTVGQKPVFFTGMPPSAGSPPSSLCTTIAAVAWNYHYSDNVSGLQLISDLIAFTLSSSPKYTETDYDGSMEGFTKFIKKFGLDNIRPLVYSPAPGFTFNVPGVSSNGIFGKLQSWPSRPGSVYFAVPYNRVVNVCYDDLSTANADTNLTLLRYDFNTGYPNGDAHFRVGFATKTAFEELNAHPFLYVGDIPGSFGYSVTESGMFSEGRYIPFLNSKGDYLAASSRPPLSIFYEPALRLAHFFQPVEFVNVGRRIDEFTSTLMLPTREELPEPLFPVFSFGSNYCWSFAVQPK